MSFHTAPQFRIETVGTHLHRARDYREPASPDELLADALLDEFKGAVRQAKKNGMTAQQVADAFEAAEKKARLAAENAVCPCGHRWADHIGRAGCMECDVCRDHRPRQASAKAPAGGAQ